MWWRQWQDDFDDGLDNAHLMRLVGRFARRVRASAAAHGIPVMVCRADERKHRIAEEYLREHDVQVGVFLILVARAPALVWKVTRTGSGKIRNLEKTRQFVNNYSFHIMDPTFGHLTIKMSGHPPFGAQVMLNGARVRRLRRAGGRHSLREGGQLLHPRGAARTPGSGRRHLSQPGTIGRLSQVIDRWTYTACLCFGLVLDEQRRSGFRYGYSIDQLEHSRNLLFRSGREIETAFDLVVDWTRVRLDVPRLRTLIGVGQRPRFGGDDLSPSQAVMIERPRWNLTLFKIHFGGGGNTTALRAATVRAGCGRPDRGRV